MDDPTAEQNRRVIKRRVARLVSSAREILHALRARGIRNTYRTVLERRALRQREWREVAEHLGAKVSSMGVRKAGQLRELLTTSNGNDLRTLDYEQIEASEARLGVELNTLSVPEILDLYMYYRYFGDLRTANFLRVTLLNTYVRAQGRESHVVPEAIAAAIELGNPKLAAELLQSRKVRPGHAGRVEEARALALALSGQWSQANELWISRFRPEDRAFLETVRGKSVAVVGPAETSDELGSEIDSFELVVRTNYRRGSNEPVSRYGSRTDISYNNVYFTATYLDEIAEAADQLRWSVLKTSRREAEFRASLPGYQGATRSAFGASAVFLHADPQIIQHALHDLVRFSPASIKLFGLNFFISPQAYSEKYGTPADTRAKISRSLRIHEPFCGFVFVKNLVRAGLLTTDALGAGVLSLHRNQYAAEFHQLYGRYTLAPSP